MSAYRAARPQGGDRIAVIGFGGLGHIALQVAKAMGHDVIAITPGKADDARKMGADEVLVVKDHVGQELQDMGGVDVILSFSPSMKQNSQSIQGLRSGGRFVTTAVSAEPIQADPISMLFKQTSIIGSAHNDPGDIVESCGGRESEALVGDLSDRGSKPRPRPFGGRQSASPRRRRASLTRSQIDIPSASAE
jgi:D-arabinose 1-dehydrogenase-like Zn-dependent alcohol dehydrogenase